MNSEHTGNTGHKGGKINTGNTDSKGNTGGIRHTDKIGHIGNTVMQERQDTRAIKDKLATQDATGDTRHKAA